MNPTKNGLGHPRADRGGILAVSRWKGGEREGDRVGGPSETPPRSREGRPRVGAPGFTVQLVARVHLAGGSSSTHHELGSRGGHGWVAGWVGRGGGGETVQALRKSHFASPVRWLGRASGKVGCWWGEWVDGRITPRDAPPHPGPPNPAVGGRGLHEVLQMKERGFGGPGRKRVEGALCSRKEGRAGPTGGGSGVGWGGQGWAGRLGEEAVGVHSLSLVGRVFFSCVSVFFSLALSKLAISPMSGLSAIFLGTTLAGGHKDGHVGYGSPPPQLGASRRGIPSSRAAPKAKSEDGGGVGWHPLLSQTHNSAAPARVWPARPGVPHCRRPACCYCCCSCSSAPTLPDPSPAQGRPNSGGSPSNPARSRVPLLPLALLQPETKERRPPLALYTPRPGPPLARPPQRGRCWAPRRRGQPAAAPPTAPSGEAPPVHRPRRFPRPTPRAPVPAPRATLRGGLETAGPSGWVGSKLWDFSGTP